MLLADLESEHNLKRTETEDKSAPKLPSATKPSDVAKVMEEVEKGKVLKHVEHQDHVAKTRIAWGAYLGFGFNEKKTEHLHAIEEGVSLKPAETKDTSNPHIEEGRRSLEN